jgi:hypothetical protein
VVRSASGTIIQPTNDRYPAPLFGKIRDNSILRADFVAADFVAAAGTAKLTVVVRQIELH